MPQQFVIPSPPQRTGIPWLDALLAAFTPPANRIGLLDPSGFGTPPIGPAAMASPIRAIPFPLPQSVQKPVQGVLGGAARLMIGQPRPLPEVGKMVDPGGLIGAASEANLSTLFPPDRIRPFTSIAQAPVLRQDPTGAVYPSDALKELVMLLRDTLMSSSRQ